MAALCAPRPLFIATGHADTWSDPIGSYLTCLRVSPVYRLLGTAGFQDCGERLPAVDKLYGDGPLAYRMHRGDHTDVIDWPLFERDKDGNIVSLSNPFTRPVDEDLPLLDEDPTKIRSTSYDTVLNGVELSSGALRIHDSRVQRKVFSLLGLSSEDIDVRFGFLVKALRYGVPPEGGFGIGVERLAMELCGTDNVRDVVAFPKNLRGAEPMSECPSAVPQEDLDVLGLKIAGQGEKNG